MPILIQCMNCKRKLRVEDSLLGKMIKCPHCQSQFPAHLSEDAAVNSSGPDSAPVLTAGEALTPPPALSPANPEPSASAAQALALPESAMPAAPVAVAPGPGPQVFAVPVAVPAATPAPGEPPAAVPLAPEPFETSPFKVFGVIAAVLLLAGLIGLGIGSLIGAAVQK